MKHFYTFALLLVALLCPFAVQAQEDAAPINFTLKVNNLDNVKIAVSYVDFPLTALETPMSYTEWTSITVEPAEGCVLKSILVGDIPESLYGSSTNLYVKPEWEGKVVSITAVTEEEAYPGTFVINVDNPDAVTATFSSTYHNVAITQAGDNVCRFDPEKDKVLELTNNISYKDPFYKVYHGETEILPTGDYSITYKISDIAQDDTIKVISEFPDEDVNVKIVFVNEGTEGAVTGVKVNDVDVEDFLNADGFAAKVGKPVSISFNEDDYNISDVDINGSSKGTWNLSFKPLGPTVVTITATKYETLTRMFHLEGTELFRLNRGYYDTGELVEIVEGDNEISYNTKTPMFCLTLDRTAQLAELKIGENDLTGNYGPYNKTLDLGNNEGDVTIKVVPKVYDKKVVFWIDSIPTESWAFKFANTDRDEYQVSEGYNLIDFCDGDLPLQMVLYSDNKAVYLNNESVADSYGQWYFSPASGDVIKTFSKGVPELFDFEIVMEEGAEATVVHDMIVPVTEFPAALKMFPGTKVKVTAPEGCIYEYTLNDGEAVKAAEYEFDATEAGKLTIKDPEYDGVAGVKVENAADGAVYNLQGIRVADKATYDQLPAGVYIVNGNKVFKK